MSSDDRGRVSYQRIFTPAERAAWEAEQDPRRLAAIQASREAARVAKRAG